MIPAHKNTKNPPGQIVTPIKTIGDYVKKVEQSENPTKKLTFDAWAHKPGFTYHGNEALYTELQACWRASRDNL